MQQGDRPVNFVHDTQHTPCQPCQPCQPDLVYLPLDRLPTESHRSAAVSSTLPQTAVCYCMTRRRRTAAAVEIDPARNAARKRTYALIPFPSTTCTSLPLAHFPAPPPAVTLSTAWTRAAS